MYVGPALVLVLVRVEVVVLGVEVEVEVEGEVVPGDPESSSQRPKADWQPAPQYSGPEPHQKKREQQGPQPASVMPGQMVELPHCPLVVMIPVGMGTKLLALVLLRVEVMLVVVVDVLLVDLTVVDVVVVEVVATGRGHPQTP